VKLWLEHFVSPLQVDGSLGGRASGHNHGGFVNRGRPKGQEMNLGSSSKSYDRAKLVLTIYF